MTKSTVFHQVYTLLSFCKWVEYEYPLSQISYIWMSEWKKEYDLVLGLDLLLLSLTRLFQLRIIFVSW